MLCLSGFELYSRWVPLFIVGSFQTITVLFIYHWIRLNQFSFGLD